MGGFISLCVVVSSYGVCMSVDDLPPRTATWMHDGRERNLQLQPVDDNNDDEGDTQFVLNFFLPVYRILIYNLLPNALILGLDA